MVHKQCMKAESLWYNDSNMGSSLSVMNSFICIACFIIRNLWYFSKLLKYFPFLAFLANVTVLSVCLCAPMYVLYPVCVGSIPLYLVAWMCSLCPALNLLPVPADKLRQDYFRREYPSHLLFRLIACKHLNTIKPYWTALCSERHSCQQRCSNGSNYTENRDWPLTALECVAVMWQADYEPRTICIVLAHSRRSVCVVVVVVPRQNANNDPCEMLTSFSKTNFFYWLTSA